MELYSIDRLKGIVRDIPDFPKPGIIFKDITPLLKEPLAFSSALYYLEEKLKKVEFSKIVAMESRGFIFGAPLSLRLNKGFVPVRKPGKLPFKTVREEYSLEYGKDAIEIHLDAIDEGEKVVIVDDLLATGGTALACAKLVEKLKGKVEMILFLIELSFLNGREKLKGYSVESVIVY